MTHDEDARVVELEIVDGHLLVTGPAILADRNARLFFRSILGAYATGDGYRCPPRRLSLSALTLRVFDWLQNHRFTVERRGAVERTVSREMERRRSFERTCAAARQLNQGHEEFDFAQVDRALDKFAWSSERDLRPHQRRGVAHALTAVNAANFSVPGAGKTATTLATAVAHIHAKTIDLVMVVGPLACFDPWEQEVRAAVGSRMITRRVRGDARRRQEVYQRVGPAQILLLSYATAAADQVSLTEILDTYKVMLVVDESHRIKRFRGGLWAPALRELAGRARVRVVLSGTPMPQSGRDLYSQLNVLWPDGQLTGSRDAFAARVDADFGAIVVDVLPFVSRTPKSALGLRPYEVRHHDAPLEGTQAEVYELIASRFRRQLAGADTWRDKLASLRRGRPIRLLQAASNPGLFNINDPYYRLPRLTDPNPTLLDRLAEYGASQVPAKSGAALGLIREIAAAGGKVVCWSNFVANLDHMSALVRRELRIPCYQIDGRVPAATDALHNDPAQREELAGQADTREEIIDRFLAEEGPCVLITNPASCSESISLHRSCHNAIYLDRTYDCALFLQSIDRIHRLGLPPEAAVTIHILTATLRGRPTIDHLVDAALTRKSDRMRELLEGAELTPIHLADDPADDADGDDGDLGALLRYLLGEAA